MQINVTGSRVLISKLNEDGVSKGGIILTQPQEKKITEAVVYAVGPGYRLPSGELVKLDVEPGDLVLISNSVQATKYEHEGETYFFVNESDILGIVE